MSRPYEPNRDPEGYFIMQDDAPLTMSFGVGRRRFARQAGNATPRNGLPPLAVIRYHVDRLELYAVANARGLGWSWGAIADELRVSKQVLHRRYAKVHLPKPRRRHRRDVAGG